MKQLAPGHAAGQAQRLVQSCALYTAWEPGNPGRAEQLSPSTKPTWRSLHYTENSMKPWPLTVGSGVARWGEGWLSKQAAARMSSENMELFAGPVTCVEHQG